MAKQDTPPTNPDAGELKQAKRILEDIAKRKGLYQEDFTSFIVTPEELAAALSRYIQKECIDARIEELLRITAHGVIYESSSYSITGPELNDRIQDLTHQKEALEKNHE